MRLKRNIKTERGKIIERAEKQLMDERMRQINNIIDIYNHLINTCMNELKVKIGKNYLINAKNLLIRIGNGGIKLY